jgi:hypothetical protein
MSEHTPKREPVTFIRVHQPINWDRLDLEGAKRAAAGIRALRDELHALHERRLARADRQAEQRQGGHAK